MGLSFFFILVELDALGFERWLGLMPCCLVPWWRFGLRPFLGAGLFAVVGVEGADVAGSPFVSVTSR